MPQDEPPSRRLIGPEPEPMLAGASSRSGTVRSSISTLAAIGKRRLCVRDASHASEPGINASGIAISGECAGGCGA